MCGRYTLAGDESLLAERFGFDPGGVRLTPRYNQAPGQDAAVVVEDGGRRLKLLRWGVVPAWAKKPGRAGPLINARAETLADKPTFKGAFRRRRCLVLADGFYEWRRAAGKRSRPSRFVLADSAPFAMAGLWQPPPKGEGGDPAGDPPADPLPTFVIVTTAANELVSPVHDRMPVILTREAEGLWLDPSLEDPEALAHLLAPLPAGRMRSYPVSTRVNSVANDGPDLIQPATEPMQQGFDF